MELRFGALSPPLHKQIGCEPDDLEFEQKMADGIALCNIHGILTDREAHNARKRIVKRISRKAKELTPFQENVL